MFVIGTAGHVDHGKTRLIEALTGIDADRLPEEKRRGLTIDLGFAHFPGADGQPVGVIDVPGHERFIRNMVAGAWSLNCGLLAVAADDGWMQQSTDHTRVLRAMGVPRLILVVTKSDVASPDRVEEVRSQALAECRRLGYPAAPAVSVSAATGDNIEELRAAILRELAGLQAEIDSGPGEPFLYIDRVFTIQGSGVVVTGSLTGGELKRGVELELLPQRRRVRVRSIQAYYQERESVHPVCRVALNLAGLKSEDAHRGNALSVPGAPVWSERELVVRLSTDEEPEGLERTIRRHGETEIAVGTGHYRVRLHSLHGGRAARVAAREAIPLRWNEAVVFIRHGGSAILGSGRVFWPGVTTPEERRRLAAESARSLEAAAPPSPQRLKLAMWGYLHASELPEPPGGKARARAAAARLQPGSPGTAPPAEGNTVRRGDWVFQEGTLRELEARIETLAQAAGGVRLSELPSRFGMDAEVLRGVWAELVGSGRLALRAGVLLPVAGAESNLSPMGRQILAELRGAGGAGLQLDRLKAAGSGKEMRNLARTGLAVSLDGNIYYSRETYSELAGLILAGLEPGGHFTITEAKERSSLSRKYIIPLLNRMEDDGLVRRDGDERVVIRLPGSASGVRTSGTEAE